MNHESRDSASAPQPREVEASAPGKVILLGEHAVVYGSRGIALPLCNCRCRARVRPESPRQPFEIRAENLGLTYSAGGVLPQGPMFPLVRTVELLSGIRPQMPLQGWSLSLRSEIPMARGLGSGAAAAVSMLRALDRYFQLSLTLQELLDLGYEVEKVHHTKPSGIDNTVITLEQPILFARGQEPQVLPDPGFELVVADTGIEQDTGEMVVRVANLIQLEPERLQWMVKGIGRLVEWGITALCTHSLPALGRVMNANHQLLRALGVSSRTLDRLTEVAREAGALGAKLTGAGGGGCMIALAPSVAARKRIQEALARAGAVRVFSTSSKGADQDVREDSGTQNPPP